MPVGCLCVLEKEGLGFLLSILVLRAVEEDIDYCVHRKGRDLHRETAQRSDGLFVKRVERTTSKVVRVGNER